MGGSGGGTRRWGCEAPASPPTPTPSKTTGQSGQRKLVMGPGREQRGGEGGRVLDRLMVRGLLLDGLGFLPLHHTQCGHG